MWRPGPNAVQRLLSVLRNGRGELFPPIGVWHMKLRICSLLVLSVMVWAVPGLGKCSPKIPATLPITSTFFSADLANNVADIQSDGLNGGTYEDGVGGVTTYLTCNGYNGQAFADWQFD